MHNHAAIMEKTSAAKIRTANYTKANPQGPGVHTAWRPTFVLHLYLGPSPIRNLLVPYHRFIFFVLKQMEESIAPRKEKG